MRPRKRYIASRRAALWGSLVAVAGLGLGAPGAAWAPDSPPAITMRVAGDGKVKLGREVRLDGELGSGERDKLVKLEYTPAGAKDPLRVDEAHTDRHGRFRLSHDPRFTGTFAAVSSKGRDRSDGVPVRVAAQYVPPPDRDVLLGDRVSLAGELRPAAGRRKLILERRANRGWKRAERVRTKKDGTFGADWKPPRIGEHQLRLRFRGDRLNEPARQEVEIDVYREAVASYYGPGFYGRRTACGQRLKKGTMGVAHKRIKCGKKVRFRYAGREVKVPVIDRGPFVAGREWDLTRKAAARLGVEDVDTIWSTR